MTATAQTTAPRLITASQRMFIADLLKRAPSEVKAPIFAKGLDGMTMAEASALIDTLKGKRQGNGKASDCELYDDKWHKSFPGVCD